MSSALRRVFVVVLFLVLAAWVYEPLLRSGPIGPDYEVLAGASRIGYGHLRPPEDMGWRRMFVAPGVEGHPIAAFSLGLVSRVFTEGGLWSERAVHLLRVENLLLLGLAAVLLGRYVQRLLLPWTGSEQAIAAGYACTMLFAVHPVSVSAVASPADHDLLYGSLFAAAAALAFLRGRQERRDHLVFLAAGLTLLCAMASDLAWMLAPALAVTEYLSAHRYRPVRRRVNTAITTLLCFGACAVVPALARAGLDLESGTAELARSLSVLKRPRSAMVALERFGYSVLPVNAVGRGATGLILGVGLILVALQPALRAARSAPRLWAGALGSWAVLMLVAVSYRLDVRVHPLDLSAASSLLPAAAMMTAMVGLSTTALTGRRRLVMPALAILALAQLARAEARCIERAAAESGRLLTDLALARSEFGSERPVLVLDPPRLVAGHPATAPRMEWMLDPAFGTAGPRAEEVWVRGIDSAGFRALAVAGELAELRAEELVVLAPLQLVEEGPAAPRARRLAVLLDRPRPRAGPLAWTGSGVSPALDVEPLDLVALRVEPAGLTGAYERPGVTWEGAAAELPVGSLRGVWLDLEERPLASFDLSSSFRWLLAGNVRRISLSGQLEQARTAELVPALPIVEEASGPVARGDDWVFTWERSQWAWPGDGGESELVLTLVDLVELDVYEVDAQPSEGELVFADAEPWAKAWREGGGAWLWTLEERRAGNTVARTIGR